MLLDQVLKDIAELFLINNIFYYICHNNTNKTVLYDLNLIICYTLECYAAIQNTESLFQVEIESPSPLIS